MNNKRRITNVVAREEYITLLNPVFRKLTAGEAKKFDNVEDSP